jgi:hypothetical protein
MAVWPAMGNGKQRAERTAWPPIDHFFSELFDYKSNTCSIFLVSIFVLVLFCSPFSLFFFTTFLCNFEVNIFSFQLQTTNLNKIKSRTKITGLSFLFMICICSLC